MKLLHFADAHIDMANYGRHDPETGLPLRVLDFLRSLDEIITAAIEEKVDLVIFSGDAYKDRTPAPTFQREWGRRIMRLSQAGIPTVLVVGNHDLSPAAGRAHAIHEFDTLQVPHVHVIARPTLLAANALGLPVQLIGLPWVTRSALLANLEMSATDTGQVVNELEQRLTEILQDLIARCDPSLPVILAAHASVEGAKYGSERLVMLGADLVLPGSLVRDPRFDYVALGHIHKAQDLNEGAHPPVIYPGSIERVDFGEASDEKFYVVAEVARGQTRVEWRSLRNIRPMVDRFLRLDSAEDIPARLLAALPPADDLENAIVRLTIEYPREWEALIDESALRAHAARAFEFHLVKRPKSAARIRLPAEQTVSSLSPLELLDQYWKARHTDPAEAAELQKLAGEVLSGGEETESL